MSAKAQVKALIDRILRLKEEQDTLSSDIREIYAEAKANGYDKTALGEVVTHLRRIAKKGKSAVDERGALFDMYLAAYEQPSHVHARETQDYPQSAETPTADKPEADPQAPNASGALSDSDVPAFLVKSRMTCDVVGAE